jgi:uncharacterized repeat protein (TIGR03803 family)
MTITHSVTRWRKFVRYLLSLILLCFSFSNSFSQYTKLLDFGSTDNGVTPYGSLVSDGTFLYGTTSDGGVTDNGTIYKLKLDGSGFTKLYDFDDTNGSHPYDALIYDGTFLYGTTISGGDNGQGVIFKIKPDGSGFTKLFDFQYTATGAYPYGPLITDGTYLYGATSQGGSAFYGTVYKIKLDGTGHTKLIEFDGTNNGGYPYSELYFDGTFLYGTTSGGFSFNGTIFKVKPDGSGYAKLLNFSNFTGTNPYGSLISDGTFLYGTAVNGGNNGDGTLFKIMPDGSNFSKVVDFDNTVGKGAFPKCTLAYDGTFLYGVTTDYGVNSRGTIFKVMTDGTNYQKLFDNTVGTNGPYPEGKLLLVSGKLYGVKSGGGSGAAPFLPGTVFKIDTDGSNYTVLHTFEKEGSNPPGSLYSDGTYLYGVTSQGGLYNYGTLFKVKPDGSGYARVLDFTGSNGHNPVGRLITDNGTFLFGMTDSGGANDYGVIYKIKPDGTGYQKLFDFDVTNGANATGSLIYDGTYLYGMTPNGGVNSYGVVFKILPDGTGFTKLYDFDYTSGAYPQGSLMGVSGFLYGMTSAGGSNDSGVAFKIKTDGTGFSKLVDFDYSTTGGQPQGSLFYDGAFLYGLNTNGGVNSNGTIFKIKPDGSGFAKIFDFDDNVTGGYPQGGLTSIDGTILFGMTSSGGALNYGTAFKIKSDGTNFIKLFDFDDGRYPSGSLISTNGFLYGMTNNGGFSDQGILFKISSTPFVSITDFTPASGVIGTTIIITGSGFDTTPGNNVVKFNGMDATVTDATPTSLTVVVPVGATTGPISLTANSTNDVSDNDFEVTTDAVMIDGTVQNCGFTFLPPNSSDDIVETFKPVNPTDKIMVSFSSFNVSDELNVYDGPDTSSPLIKTLQGNSIPADIVATGPGGELTFEYIWLDASTNWEATITCEQSNGSISIAPAPLGTSTGGIVTLNLVPLITTTGSIDLTSLEVVSPPSSGAVASINAAGVLTIDYAGKDFTGSDQITIKACDTNGNCATRIFTIDVVAGIVVYNAVSPNGINPSFTIENINVLSDTKKNTVYIFDRWENQVWHGKDYDNTSVVFTGVSDGGHDLPSGVYYYRIDFDSGRKKLTGFISLRRQ